MLTRGALSICLDAGGIQGYKNGILDLVNCSKCNHAVMIVGYGVQNGVSYWLVKNSWNTWWGDQGYFKVTVKDDDTGNSFINTVAWRPFKN